MKFGLVVFLAFFFINTNSIAAKKRLIGGDIVKDGEYTEVVALFRANEPADGRSHCTGTLIGSRVLLTRTQGCSVDGTILKFFVKGKEYRAKMSTQRGDLGKNFIALGIVDQEVAGVNYAQVGKAPQVNMNVTMLGAGPGAESDTTTDNKIRQAKTTITQVLQDKNAFNVGRQGGPIASPLGDPGGPVLYEEGTTHHILGIINARDPKATPPLTVLAVAYLPSWDNEFRSFASENNVKICGIHSDGCVGGITPPPPGDIACRLDVSNNPARQGDPVRLTLTVIKGQATTANIDHKVVPLNSDGVAVLDYTPQALGPVTSTGVITNSVAVNSCKVSYTVVKKDDPIPGEIA